MQIDKTQANEENIFPNLTTHAPHLEQNSASKKTQPNTEMVLRATVQIVCMQQQCEQSESDFQMM